MDNTRHDESRLTLALDDAVPRPTTMLDPAVVLAAGRRSARRRRRYAVAGSAAAVVLVGGGIAALSVVPVGAGGPAGIDRERAGVQAAASPGAPKVLAGDEPLPVVTTDLAVGRDPDVQGPYLDADGALVLPEAARLVAAVEEPLGYTGANHSMAVSYVPGGPGASARWTMLALRPDWRTDDGPKVGFEDDGSFAYDAPAEDAGQDFAAWVRDQSDYGIGPLWPASGLASEPYLTRAGELVMPDGGRLLDTVADPLELPEPLTSTAVAWSRPGEAEQWALLVSDPTWRPERGFAAGGPAGLSGLVNGFGAVTRDPLPGRSLAQWAWSLDRSDVGADAPPAWVVPYVR